MSKESSTNLDLLSKIASKSDIVIAADGGANYCKKLGINIDYLIYNHIIFNVVIFSYREVAIFYFYAFKCVKFIIVIYLKD